MVHPDTTLRFVSETIGSGVFATSFIPKGTLVYVIDPLETEISPQRFATLPQPLREAADKYSFIDQRGYRILSWDLAKYVNHRCEPNTISSGYGFEIAIRDIGPGEEITDEYGLFNLEWDIECHCGSENCRGFVRCGDIERHWQRWDEVVKNALQHARDVEQPLWAVMKDSTRRALKQYLSSGKGYRSVLDLKYTPAPQLGAVRKAATN